MNKFLNQIKEIIKDLIKAIGCFTAVLLLFSLVLLGCTNIPRDTDADCTSEQPVCVLQTDSTREVCR